MDWVIQHMVPRSWTKERLDLLDPLDLLDLDLARLRRDSWRATDALCRAERAIREELVELADRAEFVELEDNVVSVYAEKTGMLTYPGYVRVKSMRHITSSSEVYSPQEMKKT